MELLERLEQRVNVLLATLETLRHENAVLVEQQGHYAVLAQENALLREQLVQEQQKVATALSRIEHILLRLEDGSAHE